MSLNAVMMFAGLALLGVGLFRSQNAIMVANGKAPMTMIATMRSVVPLLIFLAVMICIGLVRSDILSFAKAGVKQTVTTTAGLFPMLAVLMVTMSVGSVVMGYYKNDTMHLLTGRYKVPGVYLVALTTPTTSALSLQVKTLWHESPEVRPQVMALMLIASFVSVGLFFFRVLGLDWDIAGSLYGTGAFISLFVYPLVLCYSKVFPYR